MDPEGLGEARSALREFALRHGLQWVVDEVDAAVAAGVTETKELRETRRQGRTTYEEAPRSESARGPKRAEEFVSRRPMTELEQVETLLGALRRVLVDLDDIAEASVEQINEALGRQRQPVLGTESVTDRPRGGPVESLGAMGDAGAAIVRITEIEFAPDEGSPTSRLTTRDRRPPAERARAAEILDAIDR